MRVFVSAQLDDAPKVRRLYRLLERAGHSITHDWTRTDVIPGCYSTFPDEAGRRASLDIDGVLNAEAYVILTDNMACGKGMYVELGAALAEAAKGQLRHVAIVGRRLHESIFYYHPCLRHYETIESYLAALSDTPTA